MDRHALERVTVKHPLGDLTLLLIVNDKTRIATKIQIGGWWGRLKTTDMQPFVLLPNGKLDFGAYPDDDIETHRTGRFAETNVYEVPIVEGEFVWMNIWNEDDELGEGRYPIIAVQELLGSSPRALIQI